MKNTYQKFLRLDADTSEIGLTRGGIAYFCTPRGASIIGSAGVDGIHFCFVRGFGETVFAVSPMNSAGEYVHPLAESFEDFLRLLLACGDTAALEQTWQFDKERFDEFLSDNPPDGSRKAVLSSIAAALSLTPMDSPFEYIRRVQSEFDYSRLRFTEEYYEYAPAEPEPPKWKVSFDGSTKGKPAKADEIRTDLRFGWNGSDWLIPEVYNFAKGIVVFLIKRVEPERLRQTEAESESPLAADIQPELILNGVGIRKNYGCCYYWNPLNPERNSPEVSAVLGHFGLDPEIGWTVLRAAFPTRGSRRAGIKTLAITLSQEARTVSGTSFRAAAGTELQFVHPVSGAVHTLRVGEYERKKLRLATGVLPAYYTCMTYTLAPELPPSEFAIRDCADSDRPRMTSGDIIGFADRPAMICLSPEAGGPRTAVSSFHFEPVGEVAWRTEFRVRTVDDITVGLI